MASGEFGKKFELMDFKETQCADSEGKCTHVVIRRVAHGTGNESHRTVNFINEVEDCLYSFPIDNIHLEHDGSNFVKCETQKVTFHLKLKTENDALQFIAAQKNGTESLVAANVAKSECDTNTSMQVKEEKSVSNYGPSELALTKSVALNTSLCEQLVITSLQPLVHKQDTSLPPSGSNSDNTQSNRLLANEFVNPVHDTKSSNINLQVDSLKVQTVNQDEVDDVALSDKQRIEDLQPAENFLSQKSHSDQTTHSQIFCKPEQSNDSGVSGDDSTMNMAIFGGSGGSGEKLIFSTDEFLTERYLEVMADVYKNKVGNILSCMKKKDVVIYHKCVAALICEKKDRAFVATIATGTHWNKDACHRNPPSPCDMHAESLCYDAAPIFFQMEMLNYLDLKDSIFTHELNQKFKLKDDVKFHLIITEPPCGWCADGRDPCYEWKDFENAPPHVPTCSSKILINSTMGIQGYVSHLIEEPIFVNSVTILRNKNVAISPEHKPTTEFMSSSTINKLPKFSIMEYDPRRFNQEDRTTFQPMNLMSSESKHYRIKNDTRKLEKAGESYVISVLNYSHPEGAHLTQAFDSSTRGKGVQDVNPVDGFSIKNQNVHEKLERSVGQDFKMQKEFLQQKYSDLKEYNMHTALTLLQKKCEDDAKQFSWSIPEKDIPLDCSWDKYFDT